jgi:serine/threonine-protein kinase
VHRDVKSQNVLIDSDGRAKVTDFGIARSLESDGLTKTGRVLGTTDYVSPEQAMGQEVDARSDIYSLGILLYEMLTGEVPFHADTVVAVAMKHVNEQMPDVQRRRREVSSALAAVVERATAKDPKKRYPDMASFLADLEGALEVEVARAGTAHGEATSVLDAVRPRRLLTPRRMSAAGVTLVLAATVAALLIAALTGNNEPASTGAAAKGTQIGLSDAQAFDPPPGDGVEHSSDVGLAIDSNPDTTWTTETYRGSPSIQGDVGKPGVGLIVDAGKAVPGRALTIRSDTGGWSLQVYGAATGPPTTLEDWGKPIGDATSVSTDQTVELDATHPSRYYLIWITELASAEGGYNVAISDVRLSS